MKLVEIPRFPAPSIKSDERDEGEEEDEYERRRPIEIVDHRTPALQARSMNSDDRGISARRYQ
jgi:hypothetical protein